jgi:hypothetical protein
MSSKPCRVQKCLNEATEYLVPAGEVCAEHKRTLPNQEWIREDFGESVIGSARPTILVGESLLALDEYVLREAPHRIIRDGRRTFNPPKPDFFVEDRFPIRVRRRGEDGDRDITLVIPPELMAEVADFFRRMTPRDGIPTDGPSEDNPTR